MSAAHADNGLLLGYGAVGLEKKDADRIAAAAPIIARCRARVWLGLGERELSGRGWQRAGCGFGGCCGQGAVLGTGGMACDSLRVRIARDSGPGALAGGCDFVCSMLINGGKCPGFRIAAVLGLRAWDF